MKQKLVFREFFFFRYMFEEKKNGMESLVTYDLDEDEKEEEEKDTEKRINLREERAV